MIAMWHMYYPSSFTSYPWQTLSIKHDNISYWADTESQNPSRHSAQVDLPSWLKEVPEMKSSYHYWAKHKSYCGLGLPLKVFLLLHPWWVSYLTQSYKYRSFFLLNFTIFTYRHLIPAPTPPRQQACIQSWPTHKNHRPLKYLYPSKP